MDIYVYCIYSPNANALFILRKDEFSDDNDAKYSIIYSTMVIYQRIAHIFGIKWSMVSLVVARSILFIRLNLIVLSCQVEYFMFCSWRWIVYECMCYEIIQSSCDTNIKPKFRQTRIEYGYHGMVTMELGHFVSQLFSH